MARVIILQHTSFTHRASGIVFEPRPTLVNPEDAAKSIVGVAEDVPADVAREHFAGHPAFRIDFAEGEDEAAAPAKTPRKAK